MKLETALNHQKRALSAIESMVYAAKVSSITSAQFNEDSRGECHETYCNLMKES
jgi:hypothetical protein